MSSACLYTALLTPEKPSIFGRRLLTRQRLADVSGRVRRLATGLAMIHLHFTDALRRGQGLLFQGQSTDANKC